MNKETIRFFTNGAKHFTPDSLLEIAIRCDEYPSNNSYSYGAYLLKADALHCAEYMERNGIKSVEHIGPFDTRIMGETVIIPKGALVKCKGIDNDYRAKKTYRVKVWNWSPGFTRHEHGFYEQIEIHDTKVTWLSDGYYKDSYDWKEVELE